MPISIKNDETEELVRKLATLTGESMTEVIRISVRERLERVEKAKKKRSVADEMNAIAVRCSQLPVLSTLSEDEILGYDEFGIPSR